MPSPLCILLVWSLVSFTVICDPSSDDGTIRQTSNRLRTSKDIASASEVWEAAKGKPRTVQNSFERQKEKMQDEIEDEEDMIAMMEFLAAHRNGFSMATDSPSSVPSDTPSLLPSDGPSFFPSDSPSLVPSQNPSASPTIYPSLEPTVVGSNEPTLSNPPSHEFWPSTAPSISLQPSSQPSISVEPSNTPTVSALPSASPSVSSEPSSTPSISREPSGVPTVSVQPSVSPSLVPTPFEQETTSAPTAVPTSFPSILPSSSPSAVPSALRIAGAETTTTTFSPTDSPSGLPSLSSQPSSFPTLENCPGFTVAERIAEIYGILNAVGDRSLIRDLNSPQGKAADWLVNQDFQQVCPGDEKLVQRWVLAVMYFATNGDGWEKCSAAGTDRCGSESPFRNKRRFLSSSNECQWAGISCNNEGCVTEVEFEENNLVGFLPTEMGLLTDLAVWGMERGGLNGTIPTQVGSLTNLVFLDFDFNDLSGTLPTELYQLTRLTQLDLNNNQLSGTVEQLGVFQELEFLQLHSNLFNGTLPEGMGNLSLLRTCTIHDTLFSGTMPTSVCALRSINGGVLGSLIAECDDIPDVGPQITCTCCSDCRGL